MKPYSKLTKEELKKLKGQLEKQFEEVKAKGIHLDLSSCIPSKAAKAHPDQSYPPA